MPTTKEFPIDVLENILERENEGYAYLGDEFDDCLRWSLKYNVYFTEPGQEENTAWRIPYYVPATEANGDCETFRDGIATLVKKVQKTIDVWEVV